MNKKLILSVLAGSVLLSGITTNVYADLSVTAPSGIQEQMQGDRSMQRGGGMMQPGTVCFRSFPVQMLISPRG